MDVEMRREKIMEILKTSSEAVSGNEFSRRLGVSRQIIVQDIALLKAVNKNILATNKGYILYHVSESVSKCRRSIKTEHKTDEILDELYTIVDFGGKVLDVVVEHEIYGQITVDLIIRNRQDADEFVKQIKEKKTRPLKELTKGVHFHTIEADSEEILDRIEKELEGKGYLRKYGRQ